MSAPVQFVPTCLAGELRPEVAEAAVTVLRALGFTVQVPRKVLCCGQPAFNTGFRPEARRVARHDARELGGSDGPIVLPSGSCAHTMSHGWGELAQGDAEQRSLAAIAERTRELTSFVVERGGLAQLRMEGAGRVAYHPSCHLLRGLGVDAAPRAVLAAIEGIEVVELRDAEECCGFGGSFSVDREPISAAMLQRKMDAVEASGADILTGCDLGCLLHIEGGLRRRGSSIRVLHIALLMAESLR